MRERDDVNLSRSRTISALQRTSGGTALMPPPLPAVVGRRWPQPDDGNAAESGTLSAAMTATGCLLFVYVYERTMRLYGYFQRMLNHPYWMAGTAQAGFT